MNPLAQSAIGSILRWALTLLSMHLVNAGIWGANEAETYVGAAVLALLTLMWSLWAKYKERLKLMVALMLPHGSTENDVNAKVAIGHVPSVMTAADTAPKLPSVVA